MIHVITGPPCAGKSTYVSEHMKEGDMRVDYDLIATALGSIDSHAAQGVIKQAAFDAREGAIKAALKDPQQESWIIHTSPSEDHVKAYEQAEAEFIELDPGKDVCLERAEADERPQQTFDGIEKWYAGKKGKNMITKQKTFNVKFKANENGSISGYASTWIREPDSWGDIVAKGAFTESIERIKAEGKVLPLLWSHNAYGLENFLGKITDLEEDDHGLKFEATFDDTPEAQRARELAMDGRLNKFSFSYDTLEEGEITLEDGRKANELRKLELYEISLVMYPANTDTSVIEVKAGRRNRKSDEEIIRQIISLAQSLLDDDDDTQQGDGEGAKSEEPDPANDEEQKRKEALLKEAEKIMKGE